MALLFALISSILPVRKELEGYFLQGKFISIIVTTDSLLKEHPEMDTTAFVHLYRAYAFSAMKDSISVDKELGKAIRQQPFLQLDPSFTSPFLYERFQKMRQSLKIPVCIKEQFYREQLKYSRLNILLPGIYQIKNNNKLSGIGLLSAYGLSLGLFTYSMLKYNRYYHRYLMVSDENEVEYNYKKSRIYYNLSIGSAVSAVGVLFLANLF